MKFRLLAIVNFFVRFGLAIACLATGLVGGIFATRWVLQVLKPEGSTTAIALFVGVMLVACLAIALLAAFIFGRLAELFQKLTTKKQNR